MAELGLNRVFSSPHSGIFGDATAWSAWAGVQGEREVVFLKFWSRGWLVGSFARRSVISEKCGQDTRRGPWFQSGVAGWRCSLFWTQGSVAVFCLAADSSQGWGCLCPQVGEGGLPPGKGSLSSLFLGSDIVGRKILVPGDRDAWIPLLALPTAPV